MVHCNELAICSVQSLVQYEYIAQLLKSHSFFILKSHTGMRLANLIPEWEQEWKKEWDLMPKVRGRDWNKMKIFKTRTKTRSIPSFYCAVVDALIWASLIRAGEFRKFRKYSRTDEKSSTWQTVYRTAHLFPQHKQQYQYN